MRTKRCPDCDLDGEVPNYDPDRTRSWKTCPRCDGSRRIMKEAFTMSEERLFQWLMISCAVLAGICGLGAVGLLVLCASSFSFGVLTCSILLAAGAVGAGYVSVSFASKAQEPKVFNNQDEKEVLDRKQAKALKKARGEVVFERAMTEVEYERDNIVHRAIEAAADPDRPPHDTRWSHVTKNVRELRGKPVARPGEER